jgi:uncharacterized protein YicC (UPF0701 family)
LGAQPFDPTSDLARLIDDVSELMSEISEEAKALVARHVEEGRSLTADVKSGAQVLEARRNDIREELGRVQNTINDVFRNVDVLAYLRWRAKTLEEPSR